MGAGGSVAKADGCPHLEKYFTVLLGLYMAHFKKRHEPDHLAAFRQDCRDKLGPYIQASFKRHDKNASGMLDKEESVLFFHNFVYEKKAFDDACVTVFAEKVAEALIVEGVELARSLKVRASELEKVQKQSAEDTHKVSVKLLGTAQETFERYQKEQLKRSNVAFDSVDINKDGLLTEKEVMEALLPETNKNRALMSALGSDPDFLKKLLRGDVHRDVHLHPDQWQHVGLPTPTLEEHRDVHFDPVQWQHFDSSIPTLLERRGLAVKLDKPIK